LTQSLMLLGTCSQASSAKLPNYLRAVLSRLETLTTTPEEAASTSNPNENELQTFLGAQLSALEPILAAPRPAGRSTLFNTNLAGAFSIPGMGSASKVDRDFSKLAKETAEGLKQRLRYVSKRGFSRCWWAVLTCFEPADTLSARRQSSLSTSSGSQKTGAPSR
jgi:hypothetical protein